MTPLDNNRVLDRRVADSAKWVTMSFFKKALWWEQQCLWECSVLSQQHLCVLELVQPHSRHQCRFIKSSLEDLIVQPCGLIRFTQSGGCVGNLFSLVCSSLEKLCFCVFKERRRLSEATSCSFTVERNCVSKTSWLIQNFIKNICENSLSFSLLRYKWKACKCS